MGEIRLDKMSGAGPGFYPALFLESGMKKQQNDFLNGSILPSLLRFAGPVLLALFLQAMYGAVDLIVVGKFAGTADISAVSTGSQAMQLVTSLLVGLTTGVTVLLGQKIGKGKPGEAGSVIGSAICLFVCVALGLTAVLVTLAAPFCRLLQAPEEAFVPTTLYVRICSAGTLFIVAFNVIGSVFRGLGDSKMPLITVAIACVVNIFGDLLLVAVFHLGAAGAALATVFAQAISVVLSLLVIARRKLPFTFRKEQLRFDRPLTAGILRLGVPIALQDVLVGVSFLVILAIVNSLGLLQSAGMGIAEKVCAFVMLLPSAFSQSVSAFVAQNTGAAKPDRAKKALRYSVVTSLCISVFVFYFNFFHGDLLAGIFANDRAVILEAADYLKAYAIDCLLTSFLFCFVGYFSGLGKTVFVMAQGILGAFGVRIPVSFFMSRLPNVRLFYIGLATPCSTVVQVLLCLAYYAHLSRREKAGPAV